MWWNASGLAMLGEETVWPAFHPSGVRETTEAGLGSGGLSTESAQADGVEIRRELFRPGDAPHRLAVRLRVANRRRSALLLETLIPLQTGDHELSLRSADGTAIFARGTLSVRRVWLRSSRLPSNFAGRFEVNHRRN